MRKKPPHAYFLILLVLIALMSLPKKSSESLRGLCISALSPAWDHLASFKNLFSGDGKNEDDASSVGREEVQRLQLENTILKAEVSQLKEVMQQEMKTLSHMAAINENQLSKKSVSLIKKRHRQELKKLLKMQLEAVSARVIFRSAGSWNSSLWINVGNSTNASLGQTVIAKNSPVIVDTSVVGVIDFVGEQQSRVRLITDSGLTPSVRAVRGSLQAWQARNQIHALIAAIEQAKDALADLPDHEDLIDRLIKTKDLLSQGDNTWYLAKGELHGASKPLWRSQGQVLKGIGFNYDFDDEEGPARDLRSGKPLDSSSNLSAMQLIQTNDLLVTTGMDGVFPPGLLVAKVKKLHFLKEGDYTYTFDAIPVLGNLDELSFVFVIPPIGFDTEEQPPLLGW